LAKREESKVPSKARSKQCIVEGGHSAKRRRATWAYPSFPKYPTSGKLCDGSKFVILFSIPSDGTIWWSTNAVYATLAVVLVLGVGSSYGHVGAISFDVDVAVSSGLGHLRD
jgi:hypothetical protein